MSATFAILTLLETLSIGQIFTTRQLLGVGSRGAIDQCLSRLVDQGSIQRLANGVFSKGAERPQITPLELAQIKAGAFHKQVFEHAQTTAERLAYIPTPKPNSKPKEHVFAVTGTSSTSFNSIYGRITLKAQSARKYREERNEVWEVLKSVWHLGKDGFTTKIRATIQKYWGRKSQESLVRYASFVPHWLFEQFPQDYEKAFQTIHLDLDPAARDELDRRYHASDRDWQKLLRDMPPGFYDFEPPARDPEDYIGWDADNETPPNCSCPEDPECICPMFTCNYCQNQPLNNRFSLRFG